MGANPHANGGLLKRELKLPDFHAYAVKVPSPGSVEAEATRVMGQFLREVVSLNAEARNFRIMGPDETASNRLDAVFDVTERVWMERIEPYDVHLAQQGRVMEVLSEHLCQGWLEGYLLTGRHGFFSCYEAFIHIVDSMFNQHAKWLKVSRGLPWRRPIASLNYLLTSHVWRQDHNGFSHQDPGFVDLVVNKKADIVRVYFPPDANTLLWITDHCLRTYDRINVIVAGKQPSPQWLTMQQAATHCDAGIGIWPWAGTETEGLEPDVVMACAGDVPTLETLAAVDLLRKALPDLRIRVVNVVDLMTLQPKEQHPHGLSDRDFDGMFTCDKPVIFAYHGYPNLIHRLTYNRTNHAGMHVRGFEEEGTTTTPFDMVVLNELDRFHLAIEVIERVPGLGVAAAHIKQQFRDALIEHTRYVRQPRRGHARYPGLEVAIPRQCRSARRPLGNDTSYIMSDAILVINAGSSSVKFSLFEGHRWPGPKELICDGEFDGIGHRVHFVAKDNSAKSLADRYLTDGATHEDAIATLLSWIESKFANHRLIAAGHRVVHGGSLYSIPARISSTVIDNLRHLVPLAPLHQPHNLAAITAVSKLHPELPQVACFDTAFHHTQPEVAATFALPSSITNQGVRRYGFHGLSYEYIAGALPEILGPVAAEGRVVVAHLGSGASMCAMHRRQSVATTMGFTALDGLPMGSRCGNLDPGVILYLIQEKGMTPQAVTDLLYHSSGLLGVSGISDDMRTLLASEDPLAANAVAVIRLPDRPRVGIAGRQPRRSGRAHLHRRYRRTCP